MLPERCIPLAMIRPLRHLTRPSPFWIALLPPRCIIPPLSLDRRVVSHPRVWTSVYAFIESSFLIASLTMLPHNLA